MEVLEEKEKKQQNFSLGRLLSDCVAFFFNTHSDLWQSGEENNGLVPSPLDYIFQRPSPAAFPLLSHGP